MNQNSTENSENNLPVNLAKRFTHSIYGMNVMSTSHHSFSELVKKIENERQIVYFTFNKLKDNPQNATNFYLFLN